MSKKSFFSDVTTKRRKTTGSVLPAKAKIQCFRVGGQVTSRIFQRRMSFCSPLLSGFVLPTIIFWTIFFTFAGCAPKTTTMAEPLLRARVLEAELEMSDNAQAAFAYLRAQELERTGDVDGARQSLRSALAMDPTPFLGMELANFYWREGRTADAREALKQTLALFPDQRELHGALVNAYLADNMVDEAITTMDAYLRDHPDDISMRQDLAALLLQYSRYSHAADILMIVPEQKHTPELRLLLARSKAGLGLTRQAMELLTMVLKEQPDFIDALTELAYLQESEGDFVQAEKSYQRILDQRQDSEDILLRLVQLNVKLNQPDKALAYALVLIDREQFLLEAILIFLKEDLFNQAQTLLKHIPEEDGPPEADFYRALAAYDGDRDAEQALAYLGRIPEDHANYARALSFQGYLLLQLNRYQDALDLARDGQMRFANMSDFLLLEAEVLLAQNQQNQASALLDQARRQWPSDTEILYRLGFLQEQLGQRGQALKTMEEVIALEPDHADALNFIGYTLAEEGRDLERALVLVESALRLKPGSAHIIDSLAWVHYKLKNLDEAWKQIQTAVDILADDPTIWEHFGDIAQALGKVDHAKKGYRNALKCETRHEEAVRRKLDAL